ncbi:hypothetical protein [Polymorphum gilvum]|uniref:Uncharacterized protein n=1 Tax=Polymorphum gilvum (strain LMG 25793 / CGMCC 1.9160 / SL003B-26A1) TaxID=991905 RepID=F2J5P4_POLGS|nr:hypothetical protein [Polymorphum gilvum]ADZ70128.1 hypothetical protein SL003B_1700 [Polymorphum gilvum SL003B-26A1]
MSRKISLNAHLAHDAVGSAETEVVLLQFTHPETEQIVRLSTDPTERLSLQPLRYGTRSSWLGADPARDEDAFLFVLVSVLIPDDQEQAPPAARLVVEGVDNELAELLRSTLMRADVSMAVVLASSPDLPEQEWHNFKLVGAEGAGEGITLTISRDPITEEPWPAGRMTRERFPGLHP